MSGRRRVRGALVSAAVAGTVLVTVGCGQDPTPEQAVPSLATLLSRVDRSMAGRDWDQAREHLHDLVATTNQAQADGKLTQEQADRIQAAVARLLSELPDSPTAPAQPSPTRSPTPSPQPTTRPAQPRQSPQQEPEKDKKDEQKKDEEKKDEESESKEPKQSKEEDQAEH